MVYLHIFASIFTAVFIYSYLKILAKLIFSIIIIFLLVFKSLSSIFKLIFKFIKIKSFKNNNTSYRPAYHTSETFPSSQKLHQIKKFSKKTVFSSKMTSYSAKRNEEDILKQQKIHQKSSFEWLSKALTIDERGKRLVSFSLLFLQFFLIV